MNKFFRIKKKIFEIEKLLTNPKKGLPEDFFLFLTRVTPMVNVDLCIKDKKKGILLTWREKGEKTKAGWHFPGGIIRYKERKITRVQKVAQNELNAKVKINLRPLMVNEIILNQKNRSHFISFLYKCNLITSPKISEYRKGPVLRGMYKWFKKCPKNLIQTHKIYKDLF
jgi:8-oxo-dGTP diphosphatase